MEFKRLGKYYIESKCGRFRISKASVKYAVVYTAWHRKEWEKNWRSIGYSADVETAISECKGYLNKDHDKS